MYGLHFALALCFFISNILAATLPSEWVAKLEEAGGGRVFFEGDMILPESLVKQAVDEGSMVQKTSKVEVDKNGDKVETETINAPGHMRWTNGVVPYVIDKDLKCTFLECVLYGDTEKLIEDAMKEWSDNTCITFKERSSERDYVHFVPGGVGICASHVGRTRGPQPIYLGKGKECLQHGIILHEIGHALGFYHEQSRMDRDAYITVNYKNVLKSALKNFNKYATEISGLGIPYDYGSIMHFGRKSFSNWYNYDTITPKQSGVSIGQRKKLSAGDIKKANKYYECPLKSTN